MRENVVPICGAITSLSQEQVSTRSTYMIQFNYNFTYTDVYSLSIASYDDVIGLYWLPIWSSISQIPRHINDIIKYISWHTASKAFIIKVVEFIEVIWKIRITSLGTVAGSLRAFMTLIVKLDYHITVEVLFIMLQKNPVVRLNIFTFI